MTDPDHKTIPDFLGARVEEAESERTASAASAERDQTAGETEPFNPFKFQSITMPPGLRAEIIEHARTRAPERTPDDTLPPNNGVTLNNAEADDAPTIRIASDNADTQRLPRVLLARARRRRQRVIAVVVPVVLAIASGVALRAHRRGQAEPPAASTTGQENAARGAAVAPSTTDATSARSTADLAAVTDAPPSAPVATQGPQPEIVERAPDPRQPPTPKITGARPHPARPTQPTAKGTSTAGKGVDLLDFEGPAPK
jgi:hypothetical protein